MSSSIGDFLSGLYDDTSEFVADNASILTEGYDNVYASALAGLWTLPEQLRDNPRTYSQIKQDIMPSNPFDYGFTEKEKQLWQENENIATSVNRNILTPALTNLTTMVYTPLNLAGIVGQSGEVYDASIAAGSSKGAAIAEALLSGGMEFVGDKLIGGIGKGVGKVTKSVPSLGKAVGKEFVQGGASEAATTTLQNLTSEVLREGGSGKDLKGYAIDALQSGAIGGISSGGFGAIAGVTELSRQKSSVTPMTPTNTGLGKTESETKLYTPMEETSEVSTPIEEATQTPTETLATPIEEALQTTETTETVETKPVESNIGETYNFDNVDNWVYDENDGAIYTVDGKTIELNDVDKNAIKQIQDSYVQYVNEDTKKDIENKLETSQKNLEYLEKEFEAAWNRVDSESEQDVDNLIERNKLQDKVQEARKTVEFHKEKLQDITSEAQNKINAKTTYRDYAISKKRYTELASKIADNQNKLKALQVGGAVLDSNGNPDVANQAKRFADVSAELLQQRQEAQTLLKNINAYKANVVKVKTGKQDIVASNNEIAALSAPSDKEALTSDEIQGKSPLTKEDQENQRECERCHLKLSDYGRRHPLCG